MFSNYICALDIGSSKVSASLACIKNKTITGIFCESIDSKGVESGSIVDSIDLVKSIGKVMKKLKEKSGINAKVLYVNLSGKDIVTKRSRAVIPLAERGNKVIMVSDIQKVCEQARVLGARLDEEIIYQIPAHFSIDSNNNILHPEGLYSHRLEVELYLVCAKTSAVQNLFRVVHQAGFEAKKVFFPGISTSKVVFNNKFKEGVNVLCDIGSDITELVFLRNGMIEGIEIMPFGGRNLSEEISKELNIPISLAEDVKRNSYGIAESEGFCAGKEVLVKNDNVYKPIKEETVSRILSQGSKSICQKIKEKVENYFPFSHINNFVIVGKGALLEGFLEMLEVTTGCKVQLGRVMNPQVSFFVNTEDYMSSSKYLNYITSLGMICEVLEGADNYSVSKEPSGNIFGKCVNKVREVYQEYF